MSELARTMAVVGLVSANAFFVVAEYSIVTARRGALAERAEAGSRGAARALVLMENPVRVISTVQVAITAIGILIGALGEPVVQELLGDGLPKAVRFLIAFGIVTYVTVVFGELVPKGLSLDRAESLASLIAVPIWWLGRVTAPVVWTFDSTARSALRVFGIEHVVAGGSPRSAADLRAMVDEAEEAGLIPTAQEELLHNVFEFASREAVDAMVPAHEVAWIDADTSPEEALNLVIESSHARIPVCRGTLDRLVGIVHARDISAAVRDRSKEPVGAIAREAYVIPEHKDLGALLREMRERREQFAVLVSEYGQTVGIVTIEDVLEQIVGEIESEFELSDSRIDRIDDRHVVVSGSFTIDDFNERFGTKLPQEGPRTLAGLVFDRLGRAARDGDEVEVDGVRTRVLEVDGARISRLEVELNSTDGSPPDRS